MFFKKTFENRSIRYTLNIQNSMFLAMSASFLALIILLINVNPYTNNSWLYSFWTLIGIELFGIFTFLQFWWFFAHKGDLIYTKRINQMLYRSLIYSVLSIYSLILWQVNRANYVELAITGVMALAYFIFSRN